MILYDSEDEALKHQPTPSTNGKHEARLHKVFLPTAPEDMRFASATNPTGPLIAVARADGYVCRLLHSKRKKPGVLRNCEDQALIDEAIERGIMPRGTKVAKKKKTSTKKA